MARRWRSFDPKVINAEFRALPLRDMIDLFGAMKAYGEELTAGFVVKNYGDGLMMVRASNRTSGRCLFFTVAEQEGVEILTALLAYKKETQEVPKSKIETARQRMRTAKESK